MPESPITQNNRPRQGSNNKKQKKLNFTPSQTSILKKWFIQHADNPYLKDESKNELSLKTGLDPKQVANWFTNVRKRTWQPIKKKNKNKGKSKHFDIILIHLNSLGMNDLMLKVKLKLDSEGGSDQSISVGSK